MTYTQNTYRPYCTKYLVSITNNKDLRYLPLFGFWRNWIYFQKPIINCVCLSSAGLDINIIDNRWPIFLKLSINMTLSSACWYSLNTLSSIGAHTNLRDGINAIQCRFLKPCMMVDLRKGFNVYYAILFRKTENTLETEWNILVWWLF
jgi:hypothetical protein